MWRREKSDSRTGAWWNVYPLGIHDVPIPSSSSVRDTPSPSTSPVRNRHSSCSSCGGDRRGMKEFESEVLKMKRERHRLEMEKHQLEVEELRRKKFRGGQFVGGKRSSDPEHFLPSPSDGHPRADTVGHDGEIFVGGLNLDYFGRPLGWS